MDRVLDWKPPTAKWFEGGKINASYNCLDRHLATQAHKAALIWEGEPGEVLTWTYAELHFQVERFTAALRKLGLSDERTDADPGPSRVFVDRNGLCSCDAYAGRYLDRTYHPPVD